MEHPKTFLLQQIVKSNNTYLKTLGELDAKHVDDISELMVDYTEQTVIETLERLKNGERIKIKNKLYSATNKKKSGKIFNN